MSVSWGDVAVGRYGFRVCNIARLLDKQSNSVTKWLNAQPVEADIVGRRAQQTSQRRRRYQADGDGGKGLAHALGEHCPRHRGGVGADREAEPDGHFGWSLIAIPGSIVLFEDGFEAGDTSTWSSTVP